VQRILETSVSVLSKGVCQLLALNCTLTKKKCTEWVREIIINEGRGVGLMCKKDEKKKVRVVIRCCKYSIYIYIFINYELYLLHNIYYSYKVKIFNNIVFQSVFKIYYSSLLNFLRRDYNNVWMRHLVYILYIRDGQGHARGRGWTWRACVQTEFDGWTLPGEGVVIYTKRKARYIPNRVSHFARYTAGICGRLRFFIFNRREKNCIRNPK